MTEPTTKKVKAVKAVEAATVEQTAAKKPAKEKPAKLKFEPITATVKISAGRVKETFDSLVPYVAEILQDEVGGERSDYAFLQNSQTLLNALTKILSNGMDPSTYMDVYDIVDELPEVTKIFTKELKEVTAKLKVRQAQEVADKAREEELAKQYSSPIRLKKADIAKVTVLLANNGIEFIDA